MTRKGYLSARKTRPVLVVHLETLTAFGGCQSLVSTDVGPLRTQSSYALPDDQVPIRSHRLLYWVSEDHAIIGRTWLKEDRFELLIVLAASPSGGERYLYLKRGPRRGVHASNLPSGVTQGSRSMGGT